MAEKLTIGLIIGGRSGEHEVSLQSGRSILAAIDRDRFDPIVLGVRKDGSWVLLDPEKFLEHADDPRQIRLLGGERIAIAADPTVTHIISLDTPARLIALPDVFFPVLHGPFGEDGTLQGLLMLLDRPFVGSAVLGSAVSMDKDVSKRVFRDLQLPITPFITVTSDSVNFQRLPDRLDRLEWPLFVKPANMGSSVGISKVKTAAELEPAVREAFRYDTKIIIETACPNAREIECAVLGNHAPQASVLGEIRPKLEFYSYEAKYVDPDGAELIIPAAIEQTLTERIQTLACEAFVGLGCLGLARVDFLLNDDTNDLYINEVNTLPGFTDISMYPKLWAASGLDYSNLLSRLIDLAVAHHQNRQVLATSYQAR